MNDRVVKLEDCQKQGPRLTHQHRASHVKTLLHLRHQEERTRTMTEAAPAYICKVHVSKAESLK